MDKSAACTGFGDCGCDVCCPEPGSGRGVGHAGAPLGRSGDTEPRPGEFAAKKPRLRFSQLHIDHPGERDRINGAVSQVSLGLFNARDKMEMVPLTENDLLLLLEQASKYLRILRKPRRG